MAAIITRTKPFPLYKDVKSDLHLAEMSMPSAAPPTALVAATHPPRTGPLAPSTTAPRPPAPASCVGSGSSGGGPGGSVPGGGSNTSGGNGAGGRRCRRGGRNGNGNNPWPSFYDPWTGTIQMWPGGQRPRAPHPGAPQQALITGPPQFTVPAPYGSPPQHVPAPYFPGPVPPVPFQMPGPLFIPNAAAHSLGVPSTPQPPPASWSPWDTSSLANAFSTVSLTPPNNDQWAIDSGASSHVTSNPGNVTLAPYSTFSSSIVVGNGVTLPVIGTDSISLLGSFALNNVLIAPSIIKNLHY